ncbi:hypothetical protein QQ045_029790 [Rhodiola kirilowii]
MSKLATLDNRIIDKYDRDEMEELENVTAENPDAEIVQDWIVCDHPSFVDISAWETYQPFDENVRVHHPHSPDIQKATTFWKIEDAILAVQKYSILNLVEYRVRKSDTTKMVLECRKGEEVCPWRLRLVVMQQISYLTVRKYGGDHICHNNSILQREVQCEIVGCNRVRREQQHIALIREGVTQREGLCVVSDRHNGILAAMREPEWQEPMAYQRVCVRHLQSNFMTKVKDEVLKATLDDVAYEKKELKFKENFAELLQLLHDKPLARKWLEDMDVELRTQSFNHGGF